MVRTLVMLCALPLLAAPAFAQLAAPQPAPSAAASAPPAHGPAYDDPAMHFEAPAGWERVPISPDVAQQQGAPTALFVLRSGNGASRSVSISISDFEGSLAEFAAAHSQSIRQDASSGDVNAFIDRRTNAALANGMPIVQLVWTLTPNGATQVRNYEDLFIDGKRSVAVKLSASAGDLDDAAAAKILSTLYAVGYPARRPRS